MQNSYVVTGGGRGIGRAIAENLADTGGAVVILELDPASVDWIEERHPDRSIDVVIGDASSDACAEEATQRASSRAPLKGWVNNAALFDDGWLHDTEALTIRALIDVHLMPALVGSRAAVRRFLEQQTGGSILNMSSHQASRPVPGCLPYATAKAAIEGMTRALAVDYGNAGIRANALAIGSVATERHRDLLAASNADQARSIEAQMALIHPLGRVGTVEEIANIATFLLSDQAQFITGAVVPVDGGRSALGFDPEARRQA